MKDLVNGKDMTCQCIKYRLELNKVSTKFCLISCRQTRIRYLLQILGYAQTKKISVAKACSNQIVLLHFEGLNDRKLCLYAVKSCVVLLYISLFMRLNNEFGLYPLPLYHSVQVQKSLF